MTQGISTERGFERLIAAVLRAVLRATLWPTFRAGRPIPEQRRRLELITRLTLPARGVVYSAASCGGVPGEFVRARGVTPGCGRDSLPARRRLLRRLARHSPRRSPVIWRAGPSRTSSSRTIAWPRSIPVPAAVDDAIAAYRGLLRTGLGARTNCSRRRFRGRRPGAGDRAQVAGAGRTPACRARPVFTLGRSWQSGPRPTAAR